MSRIIRTDANPILSKVVEYHGFVYTPGAGGAGLGPGRGRADAGHTGAAGRCAETHGTDKTRLLQAHIWLKDIADREAMNAVWSAWLPADGAAARACVQAVMAHPDYLVEIHGHCLPLTTG